ncbi:hypothetical protein [Roseibium salinum]|uniref:Uncharacterized protein n=1 Tax=Roseibium salinum TaxID=1604349 RepID=A0ABT3R0C6_9HYPH|nr:hypothetical protein [Roseibium sp. DSM 29163]MCX2722683.1 hypothetical protein [Roseibium sp. DSM 29163]
MKAFFAGLAVLIVLGVMTGVVYDYAAMDMVQGYWNPSNIHVETGAGHEAG